MEVGPAGGVHPDTDQSACDYVSSRGGVKVRNRHRMTWLISRFCTSYIEIGLGFVNGRTAGRGDVPSALGIHERALCALFWRCVDGNRLRSAFNNGGATRQRNAKRS